MVSTRQATVAIKRQNLQVQIVRWLDDRGSGWVACECVDATGRKHKLTEQLPNFTQQLLDKTSPYRQPGKVACVVLSELVDEMGRQLRIVNIAGRSDITSNEGLSLFLVLPEQLSD